MERGGEVRGERDRVLLVLEAEAQRAQVAQLVVHVAPRARLAQHGQVAERELHDALRVGQARLGQVHRHVERAEAARAVLLAGHDRVRPAAPLQLRQQAPAPLVAQQVALVLARLRRTTTCTVAHNTSAASTRGIYEYMHCIVRALPAAARTRRKHTLLL